MGIKYDGLFQLLKERNISKTQLQKKLGFSSTTIAKLAKNVPISLKVIEEICKELNCQPADILRLEQDNPLNKLATTLLEEKEMKLKGGLYHMTQIKFSYNSNHMEGSRLSEDQTTSPARVKGEMAKLLMDYHEKVDITLDDILEFHYRFECIHPFQDGNGRVGRLIMFKECLKHDIIPFIIDEAHKTYYYQGLKEFVNEPGFLRDTCLSVQDKYKEMINYLKEGI